MFRIKMPFWVVIIVALLVCPCYGKTSKGKSYNRNHLITFVKKHGDKRLKPNEAEKIVDAVLQTKNPALYLALIKTESTYYPKAVSKKGAVGLGQIMCRIHCKELKKKGIIVSRQDLYNIRKNVRATEYVYGKMLNDSNGSHKRALAMYLGANDSGYIRKTLRTYAYLQKKND